MSAETFPTILVTFTGQPKSTWSFPLDVPVARQLEAAFTKAGAFNRSEGFIRPAGVTRELEPHCNVVLHLVRSGEFGRDIGRQAIVKAALFAIWSETLAKQGRCLEDVPGTTTLEMAFVDHAGPPVCTYDLFEHLADGTIEEQ